MYLPSLKIQSVPRPLRTPSSQSPSYLSPFLYTTVPLPVAGGATDSRDKTGVRRWPHEFTQEACCPPGGACCPLVSAPAVFTAYPPRTVPLVVEPLSLVSFSSRVVDGVVQPVLLGLRARGVQREPSVTVDVCTPFVFKQPLSLQRDGQAAPCSYLSIRSLP